MNRGKRPFRPRVDDCLEHRALLSRAGAAAVVARAQPVHITPAIAVNQEYASFTADLYQKLLPTYLSSLAGPTVQQTVVQSPLAGNHVPYSGTLTVTNGSLFGNPTTAAPLTVTVSQQGNPGSTLGLFQASGRVGNVLTGALAYDALTNKFGGQSAIDPPIPAGSVAHATVKTVTPGGASGAGALYDAAVSQRAQLMAQRLVTYFNSIPIKLPPSQGIPRQPGPRNILQRFVYSQIVGPGATSLLQSILAVPLPTDTGNSLTFYVSAVNDAIAQNRIATLDGIRLIWAGHKNFPVYT